MERTQKRAQKSAELSVKDVALAEGGIAAVRRLVSAILPSDFDWAFTVGEGEFLVVWWWCHDPRRAWQNDARAADLAGLVERLASTSWVHERSCARAAKGGDQ